MASTIPFGVATVEESYALQTEMLDNDLSLSSNFHSMMDAFHSACSYPTLSYFFSTLIGSRPLRRWRQNQLLACRLRIMARALKEYFCREDLAPKFAEIIEICDEDSEKVHEECDCETTTSTCSELALDGPAGMDDGNILQENGSIKSDASSETSACESFLTASPPTRIIQPRFTRRENPAGHRKHQAWVKTSTIGKILSKDKIELHQGGSQVSTSDIASPKLSDEQNNKTEVTHTPPNKLPKKFRRGRKRKIVYKGPICYICSGKHHVRDCGLRKLKGKKCKKGKRG
ncbi:hypothetical protein DL98DRAFT_607372 [Cadophora sp. DSE1049]|nr:hypothetical protein DL98DRAFT_607372 [Cadophora sp. DSE1049]